MYMYTYVYMYMYMYIYLYIYRIPIHIHIGFSGGAKDCTPEINTSEIAILWMFTLAISGV